MAAYSLEERFKTPQECSRLLDPTAYDLRTHLDLKQNKYPFCSSSARKTFCSSKTVDTVYDADIKPRIPCVTALKSKTPRFPYEAFKPEDIEEILCRCGIENPCQCPIVEEKEEPEVVCQANVRKRLFQGPPPRSAISTGLSVPSKRDRGFEILPNGSTRRLLDLPKDTSPPFYEAPTPEFTQFYRGWKWSRWTSARKTLLSGEGPGPADYQVVKEQTETDKCQENVRSARRKYSKQLRFLDNLQKMNIKQNMPGPAHYSPRILDTSTQNVGTLAERFPHSKSEKRPGPAEYSLKRVFDLPKPPKILSCHSYLPPRAGFNTSAPRFRYCNQKSPGPGDYDANVKLCKILHCTDNAPFLISQKRWKEDIIDTNVEDDYEEIVDKDNEENKPCPNLSWQFKSKTKRFRTCEKQSSINVSTAKTVIHKNAQEQEKAPFLSSEKRFQPWFNFVPNNKSLLEAVGPAYYDPENARCYPAVPSGPLYRAPRFGLTMSKSPSPNQYTIEPSIDSISATYNVKLKANVIENKQRQVKCKWKLPVEPRILSKSERILKILNRAIDHLEFEVTDIDPIEEEPIIVEHVPMSKISLILQDVEQSLKLGLLDMAINLPACQTDTESKKMQAYTEEEKITDGDDMKTPEKGRTGEEETNEKAAEAKRTELDQIVENEPKKVKDKMLRTFLYKNPQKIYF